jgi:hypothetical protein
VGTGVFGRFLFGLVPAQAGRLLALSDVRDQLTAMEKQVLPQLEEATNAQVVRALFEHANKPPARKSFIATLLDEPVLRSRLDRQIKASRPYFPDGVSYQKFKDGLLTLNRARLQIAFYASLKRLFRTWLVLHIVLAVFMVVLIAAHVSVTLWLGFAWILTEGA